MAGPNDNGGLNSIKRFFGEKSLDAMFDGPTELELLKVRVETLESDSEKRYQTIRRLAIGAVLAVWGPVVALAIGWIATR